MFEGLDNRKAGYMSTRCLGGERQMALRLIG
jgi:hypothetical protein